jgi:hypothetical protein
MKRRELLKTGALAAAAVATGAPALAGPYAAQRSAQKSRDQEEFTRESKRIYERHFAQTRDSVQSLRRRYEKPVLGKMRVWDLLDKLALCVDASDHNLACTNQLIHVQQVVEGMETDGVTDPDLYLAALTHDLGKVLLLAGEAQENVVCANTPIGEYAAGAGLEQVVFQWNHDEFIYSRLKAHLPEHVAWLVRYHSIMIDKATPYMDARDHAYTEKYLVPFRRYDLGTKSLWRLPPRQILDQHRELIDRTFPQPIAI